MNWVEAENTGIPYALSLALRGKSTGEIARETGIAEWSLSGKDMLASWPGVDKRILNALALALDRKSITEIARETGIPTSSLYSIRKYGPHAHRNKGSGGRISGREMEGVPEVKPRTAFSGSIPEKARGLAVEDVQMDDDMREMARWSYGYGRWDAPYWFIGPEQSQGCHEKDNDLKPRLEAWLYFKRHFRQLELNDCRDFHDRIGEQRWHGETPQRTWRRLMLLLMTFLGRPTDDASLLKYQRDEWGRLNGETCVIELSGLAAKSAKIHRDRTSFRPERIKLIRERMLQNKPELVVMYGRKEKRHWEAITEQRFPPENILKLGRTIVALALHPTTWGNGAPDDYWQKLGERLRSLSKTNYVDTEVTRTHDP
ncbi:MAG: hypothetical protein ABSD64_01425 [Terriglobales bacterium]